MGIAEMPKSKRSGWTWCLVLIAGLAGVSAVFAAEPEMRGKLLARERCAKCHGIDGRGNAAELPSLAGQHAEYIVKQLFHFKTGERINKEMDRVVEALSAGDIEAVAGYFSSLPPRKVPAVDVAQLAAGRDLYFRGIPELGLAGCVACHGPDGSGGALMPRIAGQSPVYLETQLRGFIQKSRHSDRGMHAALSVMTERDVRAVAAFLGNEE